MRRGYSLLILLPSVLGVTSAWAEQTNQTTTGQTTTDPATTDPATTSEPEPDAPLGGHSRATISEAPGPSTSSAKNNDTEEQARAAFHQGDGLYLEGDYRGAVEAFERAYALSGRIEMLFNLANAHERLGNYDKASVALRGYIPHSAPEHRKSLEKRLSRFEQLADEKSKKEKEKDQVVKDLKENPRPFPVERGVGLGLLTLGGASLVVGTAFAISTRATRTELDDICESGEGGRLCPADAESTIRRDKTHSAVADISLVSGVVLAATGTYLLVVSKKKERQRVELKVGLGPGRLMVGGKF